MLQLKLENLVLCEKYRLVQDLDMQLTGSRGWKTIRKGTEVVYAVNCKDCLRIGVSVDFGKKGRWSFFVDKSKFATAVV